MSDGTKSEYTKTGEKVMCISSNRRALTYRKVYDVFTTQDSVYFIIDDAGDKRYESLEFPYWCENPDGMVDKANETKHKSKAGKKVKSIYNGSADLTYNKVYDVFIDNEGDEFIIDDVGDKRYWSISDDDYYELVDDTVTTTNDSNDNTKTKPKFKVGKKVKSIANNRIDLTYNGVYDVFIDSDEYEFIIDDIGHKRYVFDDNKNYFELVDDNETKPKFKVGDKVKVVDIGYISQATSDIKVGDVGVITDVDSDYVISPYRVEFDDDYWWFTDKCIELVYDDAVVEHNPTEKTPIVSDGGSSSYYAQQIPKGMLERFNATGTIEAKDIIRLFLGNDFNMGNIFKAYCRVTSLRNGKGKAGVDEEYDLTKAKYFTEDELNYYLENTNA